MVLEMKVFMYFIAIFQMGTLNQLSSGLIKNFDAVFFEDGLYQGIYLI
jgi:hypothetical protein